MCLVNGTGKKLWVRLGLWEGCRSALQKEVLTELLETRGLIRESGRRQNESSQACGEGPAYTEADVQQQGHSRGLRNLGVRAATENPHPDPKTYVLGGSTGTGKERAPLWLLGALCSLLSVLPGLSWCQIGFCPATCSLAGLFLGCTRSVSTEDLELVVLHISNAWVVPLCPLLWANWIFWGLGAG